MSYETLRVIWWLLLGVLLVGFAIMDGFDLGTAALLPFVGRSDIERRVAINTVGPGMGRQPGLVHPRRRRDLRRLARALCRELFRLLSRHVPGAGGADPAAGGFQVPQQTRRYRAGGACGTGRCLPAASCRRWCSAWRSAICSRACHLASTTICACIPTITLLVAAQSLCAACAAWSALAMIVMHGAAWLNLKTGGPVQARAHAIIPLRR